MKAAVATQGKAGLQGDGSFLLVPGKNIRTGVQEFAKHFKSITSLESDLLVLASAVFSVDLAAKRGAREDIVRDIELTVPVVNFHALNAQRQKLEEILHLLSHDNWTITFVAEDGETERPATWLRNGGVTLLFSGGLDSFAGAVDLIDAIGPGGVLLASHATGNPSTTGAQNRVHEHLEAHYGEKVERVTIRTGGKKDEDEAFAAGDPEITQRTRSFMFLTIAALSARRAGHNRLVMIAENGQMAIHLPLSSGRIGAFSTQTAHPSFVAKVAEFFSDVTQFSLTVENPYLYKTKAEVVQKLVAQHGDAVNSSVSCWKAARVASGHCGICIPCFIRRISLEHNGMATSGWARDIFAEDVLGLSPTDDGKRNLVELAGFADDFRNLPESELDIRYCELYSEYFDRNQAAAMYRRFGLEAERVFLRYPGLVKLL